MDRLPADALTAGSARTTAARPALAVDPGIELAGVGHHAPGEPLERQRVLGGRGPLAGGVVGDRDADANRDVLRDGLEPLDLHPGQMIGAGSWHSNTRNNHFDLELPPINRAAITPSVIC